MILGKELALLAKGKKICAPAYGQMRVQTSVKELCKMYFEGDDWAMEKDFPALETLRKFKGNSDDYGLCTDFKGLLSNKKNTALFGESEAGLDYNGYFAGILIVRHDSKAEISVKDYAFLVINALDNADISINSEDNSRVTVFKYSENCKINFTGNVTIKNANFK